MCATHIDNPYLIPQTTLALEEFLLALWSVLLWLRCFVLLFPCSLPREALSTMARKFHDLPDTVQEMVFSFLVTHKWPWTRRTHFGMCGQSCGCCRAHNKDDWPSGCQVCLEGWNNTTLCCSAKRMAQTIAQGHEDSGLPSSIVARIVYHEDSE